MSFEQAPTEVTFQGLGSYTEVDNNTDGILSIRYGANISFLSAILDGFKEVRAIVDELAPEVGVGYAIKFTPDAAKALIAKYGAPDTTVTQAAVNEAVSEVLGKGLNRVDPGGQYRSPKLALSLIHQANVVLVLPFDPRTFTFTIYYGSFTVWTGATPNSTRKYQMADQLSHLKKEVLKIEILDGDHAAKDIGSGEISIEGIPLGSYTEVINNTAGVLCIRYGANTGILGVVIEGFKQVGAIVDELAPELGVGFAITLGAVAAQALIAKYGAPNTTVTQAAINEAISQALNNGLRRVDAGGHYDSEKLTLSLVHQANVVLVMPADPATSTFAIYSGSFTVWSGATLNSTKKYNLSDQLGHLQKQGIQIKLD